MTAAIIDGAAAEIAAEQAEPTDKGSPNHVP
jgi:hypothetical protein